MYEEAVQESLFGPDSWCGKMSPERSAQTKETTSAPSLKRQSGSQSRTRPTFHCLQRESGRWLTAGTGMDGPSPTEFSTRSFGEFPSAAVESRLSQILEDTPHPKYSLSAKACAGILRRAERRGEEAAARTGSGAGRTSKRGTDYLTGWDNQEKRVFSTQGVTQTLAGSDGGGGRTVCGYIYDARENGIGHTAAGFKAGNGAKANGIGYQEEVAPTLSAVNSGTNQVPAVAVFENHGQDSRITGPLRVFPTVSAKFGTGGNNTPLVMATGQGGAEILENLCPTMNCNHEQPIVTETGCLTPWDIQSRRIAGADGISQTLYSKGKTGGAEGQTVFAGIVRRLTPLECERLQGYPDGWTDIGPWTDSAGKLHKKSSDSARYKALGNSIALPPWSWVLKRLCACYERTATMASLFDGIGGFPLIWERLNGPGSCLWASEIEEFPIAVTRRRFGGKETEP